MQRKLALWIIKLRKGQNLQTFIENPFPHLLVGVDQQPSSARPEMLRNKIS
jgi:hypothetical protein